MKKEEVKKRIKERYLAGKPLNISAVKRECPELLSAAFSQKPFWGWYQAVTDAGVDYRDIRVELQDKVKCELCGREFWNLASHLLRKHEVDYNDYHDDYPDSSAMSETLIAQRSKFFGRHGTMIPHWEHIWTNEYVLDRFAAIHRHGYPMHYTFICSREMDLITQIYNRFSSYDDCIELIGLSLEAVRKGTARWRKYPDGDSVISAVKKRQQLNLPLTCIAMTLGKHRDRMLIERAVEYFGSWRNALKAAGLDPDEIYLVSPKRTASQKQAFLKLVRKFSKTRESRLPFAVWKFKKLQTRELHRWFFAWGKMCDEAGVPAGHLLRSKCGRRNYPDGDSVISAVKKRQQLNLPLTSTAMMSGKHRDCIVIERAREYFGSWRNALKAAGLDPDEIYLVSPKRTASQKQAFLKLVRKFSKTRESRLRDAVREFKKLQASQLHRWFSEWVKVCDEAGVPAGHLLRISCRRHKYPDGDSVISAVKKRQQLNLPLTSTAMTSGKHRDSMLIRRAQEYFGSWRNALKAAGYPGSRKRRK